jgi:hypothetical protein
MNRYLPLSFAALALVCTPVTHSETFSTGLEEYKFSRTASATAKTREGRIRREISRLPGHEWAGSYYHGDGLGVNVTLVLAPASGFVFRWHGCMGLYDQNYGEVVRTSSGLKLRFVFPNSRKGFEGMYPELVPVRWSARHYLVGTEQMVAFCNAVNAGTERGWRPAKFLLREGDEKKPVSGLPLVPANYQNYLLSEPVTARIISVQSRRVRLVHREGIGKQKERESYVTLNVGRADGILPGMELHVRSPDVFESAEVRQVAEHTCQARIYQSDAMQAPPTPGWGLSTKLIEGAH